MAENDIGKVSFGIEAAFDPKGLKDAERGLNSLAQAGSTAERGMTKFGAAVSVAGGVLAADLIKSVLEATVKVATFAFTVTESSSAIVESVDKMAQATGLSLRTFQELEPVMRKNGVSAEQMGGIFRILARNIHEAKDPTSQAGQAFDQLGIALSGMESPSEVLTLIADRVSQLPNGFEKARLVTELLGRSGTQLTAVLNEGAAGFQRSAEAARAMGNVLSNDANKALLDVNDSFDMLDVAQDNLSKHLGVLFAPMVQAVNEGAIAALQKLTVWIDDVTIATRTLAVRLEALFGFLKAQAQLSLSEIGKVPEFFERWNHWAEEQIKAIRNQSIAVKGLGSTLGTVDDKAQAAAAAQQKAWQRSSMGLMQLDMGWKIVQESITAYGRSQEALGRYITTKLIAAYNELRAASELWAKSDFDATNRNIDQFKAMETQLRATAAASDQAALAGGIISPVQFEQRSGALALGAIDAEISAQRQRLTAITTFYAQKMTLAEGDAQAQRELLQQQLAETSAVNNSLAVLQQQRVTQSITNGTAIEQAGRRAMQDTLAARTATAQAEVAILQASFADVEQIRAAQLEAVTAQMQQELAVVGLTEDRKLAIYRQAEAQRMNIARQFPTFWQKQLQDLQASNVFSMAQISSSFSSAVAQMIVTGQGFAQFWRSLQVTMVQAVINAGIQMGAEWLLRTTIAKAQDLLRVKSFMASEAVMTGVTSVNEAARLGIVAATNKAMLASTTTTLGAIGAVGNAAIATLGFVLEAVVAFMMAMASAVSTIPFVGQALAGAIIVGATIAQAVGGAAIATLTGSFQAMLGGAIVAATTAFASPFASGGIVKGPTMGMIGEAGSSEAVIPLNSQGASFMADMLGIGKGGAFGGNTTIIVELDGTPILRHVTERLPSMLRLRGVPA